MVVQDSQIGDEEHGQPHRRVEAEADETEHPEESLKHKVGQVGEEVEGKERARRSM